MRCNVWAAFLALILGAWSSVVTPTNAQNYENAVLPSSTATPLTIWRQMRPSSFPATPESAKTQCLRTAAIDQRDTLTPDKCTVLYEKLTTTDRAHQCQEVQVPDGISFDFMNGRHNGRSGVDRAAEKKLGRLDRADLCDLGDGVYSYFFRGDPGKSCNNVGFVLLPTLTPIDYSTQGSSTVFKTQEVYFGGAAIPIGCSQCCVEYFFAPSMFIGGTDIFISRPNN